MASQPGALALIRNRYSKEDNKRLGRIPLVKTTAGSTHDGCCLFLVLINVK
jgi:hypothetical protein